MRATLRILQDKKVKGKIDARNALETSVYNMKSSVEDKLKDKISAEDAKKVKAAITEINEWLDENSDAEQVRNLSQSIQILPNLIAIER